MTQTSHRLAGTLTCARTRLATAPSLAVARSKPRPGDERLHDYGEFCNIVGGVVSPVLSNVFLHYVLDDWFAREVQPRLKGKAFLIRYADDAVIGLTDERDARRVLDVLPKRFGRYGLRLHPEKIRLVRFHRPPRRRDHKRPSSDRASGTFDLLGFTHYWGFVPERELGGETQDGPAPVYAGITDDRPLVSV